MIVVLIWRPQGLFARGDGADERMRAPTPGSPIRRRPSSPRGRAGTRWRSRSGSRRCASIFLLPSKHLILTEIAILALFALSLDLILGYAGIISLGHAAFFGFGAYVAGLLAKHGIINEPVLALLVVGPRRDRCSASSRASWCCAAPTSRA